MSGSLDISPTLQLPLDAVTETFAILAKRRAGKSNAAVVMAEQMHKNGLPWIAIDPKGDWWGVRAAGDGRAAGLPVLVFGGRHGDVPLEPTSGTLVAQLIIDQNITCVLDVSEMTKADQRRFLIDFAYQLYRSNTTPRHVFCEEADEYIPQRVMGENAKLVGAFETLVKRGGFRGLGICLITQRSASLNKDVLTQVETLIAMRTPSPQDRKAVLAWVDYHAAGAGAVAELPGLADGEAWVFSPQWLKTLTKIQFHRRQTFDSGATPKVGSKPRPPATLAKVDIDAIKAAMASTIEKAQASDPRALQARIRTLEADLQRRPETEVQRVEVPVVSAELTAQVESALDNLGQAYTSWTQRLAEVNTLSDAAINAAENLRKALAEATTRKPLQRPSSAAIARPRPATAPAAPAKPARFAGPATGAPSPEDENLPALRSGARRMVEALARMAPLRLTKGQWGTVAQLKTTGGTWSTYLSDIRRRGYLDETSAGYTLTDAGFACLGGRPEPMTADELQTHYLAILRAGASKMLEALIAAYPGALSREELGAAADIVTTGGTFSTYLSDLVRNGLAERDGGDVVATRILMHGPKPDHGRATPRARCGDGDRLRPMG